MNVSADEFTEVLSSAKDENEMSPLREGNVVTLPAEGEVLMTGDIHDHRNNFSKLIRLTNPVNNPKRHGCIDRQSERSRELRRRHGLQR